MSNGIHVPHVYPQGMTDQGKAIKLDPLRLPVHDGIKRSIRNPRSFGQFQDRYALLKEDTGQVVGDTVYIVISHNAQFTRFAHGSQLGKFRQIIGKVLTIIEKSDNLKAGWHPGNEKHEKTTKYTYKRSAYLTGPLGRVFFLNPCQPF